MDTTDPAWRLAEVREQLAEQSAKLREVMDASDENGHQPGDAVRMVAPSNALYDRLANALMPKAEPAAREPSAVPEGRVPAPNAAQGSSASGQPTADDYLTYAAQQGDWAAYIALQSRKLQQDQP